MRPKPVLLALVVFAFLLGRCQIDAQTMAPFPAGDMPTIDQLPTCVPAAPAGYVHGKCLLKINRQSPISPPPLLVPPNTRVVVEVFNTRGDENVLFNLSTTHTTPPDVLAAALKGAITPLQSLVFTQKVAIFALDGGVDPLDAEETRISNRLKEVQPEILRAATALMCLSNYQTITEDDGQCSQANLMTPATFETEKKIAVDLANQAAQMRLPLAELQDLTSTLSELQKRCFADVANGKDDAEKEKRRKDCVPGLDRHLSNQARLSSAASDIQKAQATLLQTVLTLSAWPSTPSIVAYQFISSPLNNMVVTVSGQEIVNKTNSPIATVTINCQATHWVISTGILFSNLKFHTYANAPIIVDGQPVLDSSGKVLTKVTRSDTSPSVVAPILLANYRINYLSRFKWEAKCRNGCSFLLAGCVGANLTSKTADFDTGISFQFGSVLFTPTVHYGRDNRLPNGVAVGQELGPSPPNPLPTENHWVKKFGFAISYALPTP